MIILSNTSWVCRETPNLAAELVSSLRYFASLHSAATSLRAYDDALACRDRLRVGNVRACCYPLCHPACHHGDRPILNNGRPLGSVVSQWRRRKAGSHVCVRVLANRGTEGARP